MLIMKYLRLFLYHNVPRYVTWALVKSESCYYLHWFFSF